MVQAAENCPNAVGYVISRFFVRASLHLLESFAFALSMFFFDVCRHLVSLGSISTIGKKREANAKVILMLGVN